MSTQVILSTFVVFASSPEVYWKDVARLYSHLASKPIPSQHACIKVFWLARRPGPASHSFLAATSALDHTTTTQRQHLFTPSSPWTGKGDI